MGPLPYAQKSRGSLLNEVLCQCILIHHSRESQKTCAMGAHVSVENFNYPESNCKVDTSSQIKGQEVSI